MSGLLQRERRNRPRNEDSIRGTTPSQDTEIIITRAGKHRLVLENPKKKPYEIINNLKTANWPMVIDQERHYKFQQFFGMEDVQILINLGFLVVV